jgi:hypothetical protein
VVGIEVDGFCLGNDDDLFFINNLIVGSFLQSFCLFLNKKTVLQF